jgi:hypothetical protein
MLQTGADLIRTAGHSAERLRTFEPVRPVASAGQSQSSLDGDTQNALLRFARFIKKDQDGKPVRRPSQKARKKGLYEAYLTQVSSLAEGSGRGAMIDIYI